MDFDKIAKESGTNVVGPAGPSFKTPAEQVGQLELGQGGLSNIAARFSVAQGNTLEEKIAAFESIYPEGDLRLVSEAKQVKERIPGIPNPKSSLQEQQSQMAQGSKEIEKTIFQPYLVFREDPSQPYRKVDPSIREKFEPINDLVDFVAEDLGAVLGEIAMAARTKGVSLLIYLRNLAMGAMGGEAAQQLAQELAGVGRESAEEVTNRMLTQGALSVAGGALFRPGDVGLRTIRGGGVLKIPPERREALAAFERLGLELPLPGQISDNPFIVRLQDQSSATLPTLPRFVEGQIQSVVQVARSMRSPEAKSNFLASLERTQKQQEESLMVLARRARGEKVGLRVSGKEIKKGQKALDRQSRNAVNDAYAVARSIEEPAFDIAHLQIQAKTGLRGTPFAMRKTEGLTEASLKEYGLDDQTIRRLTEDAEGIGHIGTAEHLDPAFARIAKQISQADPGLPPVPLPDGSVATATDQLRAWRSELADLARPKIDEAGRVRRGNAQAQILKKEIDAVLANPQTTNQEFRQAWDVANNMAHKRFKRLELDNAAIIASSQRPAALVRRFIRPNAEDDLIQLKQLVTNDAYASVQQAFKNDLLNDPKNMLRRLDSFDKPTLNLLLSQEEQKAFRQIATQFDQLERQGLSNIVATTQQADAAMKEILSTGMNQADRRRFVASVTRQGENSIAFRSTQASLIDYVWKSVVEKQKNRYIVNPRKLKNVLNELREKEMLPLLGAQRQSMLKDLEAIADFLPAEVDFGSSLLAASVISEFRKNLTKPGKLLAGPIFRLLHLFGVGRFMASPKMRRVLLGTAQGAPDNKMISLFGAALTTIVADKTTEATMNAIHSGLAGPGQEPAGNIDYEGIANKTGGGVELPDKKEYQPPKKFTSDEEFDQWPTGTEFIDPEGNVRVKP